MIALPMRVTDLDAAILTERARLVRLCARLTGDWDAAEDLAQETLVEAWRALDRLRDPDGLAPWLNAIARNVCLRWRRERARDAVHLAQPESVTGLDASLDAPASVDPLEMLPAGADELTIVLERTELAALLDRALALLPAGTRTALVGSYIHDLPHAELAARLGLSSGALRVRLHRGKLALRRALTTDLRDDALALGLAVPTESAAAGDGPSWQTTRIWCPFCGAHHLAFYRDGGTGEYAFRCTGGCQDGIHLVGAGRHPALLAALVSPKSILTRHCLGAGVQYRRALGGNPDSCPQCGALLRVRHFGPDRSDQHDRSDRPPHPVHAFGISLACPVCNLPADINSPWHLTIDTEAAQRFWRRHPRMRALPARAVELDGRPAVLTRFQSLTSPDHLDIIAARDTYDVLSLDGDVS